MKRALLSALVLVILAAAGLAGWMVFGPSSAEAADHAPAATAEARFVKLNPLMLPILSKRRVEQTVGLVVALELNNPSSADFVEKNGPKLTDAFLTDLYGALEPSRLSAAGLVDLEMVKGRLAKASDRVLGDGIVKEVLVQMVNQRPIAR